MAKTIDTLAVKIIADASDATQGFLALKKEVNEAARIAESLGSPLDALTSKQARLGQLLEKGALTQDTYTAAMGRLKARMSEVNSTGITFGNVANQIPIFGQVFAAATSAAGAVALLGTAFRTAGDLARTGFEFIVDSGKRIDDVADQAERLGITVGGLSELKVAASFADVKDFGAVTAGMEKMLVSVSKGGDAFKVLGLNTEDLIGLKPDQMFARIAKEIAEIPTNAQRMEIIREIFGKSGNELKTLIEHLDEFKNKAGDIGAVITQDQADAIGKADQAVTALTLALEGLGNVLATNVAPAFTDFVGVVTTLIEHSDVDLLQFLDPKKAAKNFIASALAPQEKTAAQREREERENAAPSDAQKRINEDLANAKAEKDAARSPEAIAARKEEEQFTSMESRLREEIVALEQGKQAAEDYKLAHLDMADGLKESLQFLVDTKRELEAVRHAEDQDARLKKERSQEAEQIRQASRTAEEAARDRVLRAQDLVTTGELSPGSFDKMLTAEASKLTSDKTEQRLAPKAFGSQEAIAATLGRKTESDSERLESIKQSLLQMSKLPPVEIKEIAKL